MKKQIALLLASLVLLSSCGKKEEANTQESTTTTQQEETLEESSEPEEQSQEDQSQEIGMDEDLSEEDEYSGDRGNIKSLVSINNGLNDDNVTLDQYKKDGKELLARYMLLTTDQKRAVSKQIDSSTTKQEIKDIFDGNKMITGEDGQTIEMDDSMMISDYDMGELYGPHILSFEQSVDEHKDYLNKWLGYTNLSSEQQEEFKQKIEDANTSDELEDIARDINLAHSDSLDQTNAFKRNEAGREIFKLQNLSVDEKLGFWQKLSDEVDEDGFNKVLSEAQKTDSSK
ncbi:MAG: hypothetical protein Q4B36_07995 [Tissierellia bacterium]|nr:hypothetical protein [Tissierellia bacterium]